MSITVNGYLNQYYSGTFRFGALASSREGRDKQSLTNADMHAVKSALKDLKEYDYDDGDGEDLTKKVQAYVQTYNNMIDSVGSLGSEDTEQYLKKMKKLTKEQRSELEDIGISVQSDGKLKIDKEQLGKTSRMKVNKVFGKDAGYSAQLEGYMKKTANVIRLKNIGVPKQDQQLFDSLQQTLNNSQVNISV